MILEQTFHWRGKWHRCEHNSCDRGVQDADVLLSDDPNPEANTIATRACQNNSDSTDRDFCLTIDPSRDVAVDMTDYYSRRHRSVAQPG
jgi:hypothetical protein